VDDLKAKYDGMHASGVAKLQSGDFPFWTGITAEQGQNLVLAAKFQPSVQLGSILDQIGTLGDHYGISLSIANRDYPFHVTIKQGTPSEKAQPLPNLVKRFEVLCDETFTFGHLILGPNILLASSKIPTVVTKCRTTVSQVMEQHGVKPADISILHATIARVTSVADSSKLPRFVEMLETSSELVALQPFKLTVLSLFLGTSAELDKLHVLQA
jgi:hypothetical protein